MAAAYTVADGGPVSESVELNIIAHINAYGYGAIYDRPLSYGEIVALNIAQNVRTAYQARSNHNNGWAEWAAQNQAQNKLLNAAMLAANGD